MVDDETIVTLCLPIKTDCKLVGKFEPDIVTISPPNTFRTVGDIVSTTGVLS